MTSSIAFPPLLKAKGPALISQSFISFYLFHFPSGFSALLSSCLSLPRLPRRTPLYHHQQSSCITELGIPQSVFLLSARILTRREPHLSGCLHGNRYFFRFLQQKCCQPRGSRSLLISAHAPYFLWNKKGKLLLLLELRLFCDFVLSLLTTCGVHTPAMELRRHPRALQHTLFRIESRFR